ncbi:MAG TPA: antitoxin [Polyangia bacterium]|nr:antitoxin [Polyangia bacterium]
MRTTLTLDADVERLLEEEVHRVRRPFKQVVNDAIRRGLAPRLADTPSKPYRVKAHKSRLAPGIDSSALNRLVDELEDESVLGKLKARRR